MTRSDDSKTVHTGGRTRMSGEQRRRQLIDSAIALFAQHGFKGTTTKSLAQAAGISEATIFRYFPTKADLYASVFQDRLGFGNAELVRHLEALAERGDDDELIRVFTRTVLEWYRDERDLHRMLLYVQLEQGPEDNNKLRAVIRRSAVFGFLNEYVTRRQAEGIFAPGDPKLLVRLMAAPTVWYGVSTKLYGWAPVQGGDEQVVEAYSRFILAGLRGGAPTSPDDPAPR